MCPHDVRWPACLGRGARDMSLPVHLCVRGHGLAMNICMCMCMYSAYSRACEAWHRLTLAATSCASYGLTGSPWQNRCDALRCDVACWVPCGGCVLLVGWPISDTRDTTRGSDRLQCKGGVEGWVQGRIVCRCHVHDERAPYGAKGASCIPPPAC